MWIMRISSGGSHHQLFIQVPHQLQRGNQPCDQEANETSYSVETDGRPNIYVENEDQTLYLQPYD